MCDALVDSGEAVEVLSLCGDDEDDYSTCEVVDLTQDIMMMRIEAEVLVAEIVLEAPI